MTLCVAVMLSALVACGKEPEAISDTSPTTVNSSLASDDEPDSPNPSSPSPPTTTPTMMPPSAVSGEPNVSEVATDLVVPWAIVPLRDNSMLVSERDSGDIVRILGSNQQVLRTLPVAAGGEGGLLGLAATSDGSKVFAYYSTAEDNRIVGMSWDGSDLGEPQVIFDGIPHANVHNGGGLVVGPDGLLYAGTGDARESQNAQDQGSFGGKILRLQLDGQPAPGNPFGTAVYSYGHRNVQGLAFSGGRLWASEFGASTWDELNMIEPGGNYGWPEVEGIGEVESMTNPKVVWPTSEASPSGLAYWRGSLWMSALRGEALWQVPVEGESVGEAVAHLSGTYGRLRGVAVATDGGALLVSTSNRDQRGKPAETDDRILLLTWS